MFVLMTAVLITGVCVLAIIFFVQMHRTAREIALIEAETEHETNSIHDSDGRLEEKLTQQLIEGADVRECVDQYRRERAALLPGNDATWDDATLMKQRQQQAAREAREVKQRSLFSTAVAAVLTVFVVAGVTLAIYAVSSSGENGDPDPLPPPSASAGSGDGQRTASK
jgi:cell division protein FtsL